MSRIDFFYDDSKISTKNNLQNEDHVCRNFLPTNRKLENSKSRKMKKSIFKCRTIFPTFEITFILEFKITLVLQF